MVDGFDFREFVARQQWVYAKTYAKRSPHQYIVRGKINGTDEEFVAAAEYIKKHGFTVRLFRTNYTCLQMDKSFYWSMNDGDGKLLIINRNDLNDYDVVLYVKDKQWQ